MDPALNQSIFQINDQKTFRAFSLKVFHFQATHVPVYKEYLEVLGVNSSDVKEVEEIPFLPVEFFKTHTIICEGEKAEIIFESSGTTASAPARHYIPDVSLYEKSFYKGFFHFFGDPQGYLILALLPSYLERSGSSLVHMMDHLIGESKYPHSGFYLDNLEELTSVLEKSTEERQPTLLMGVSFALLDLAEQYPMDLGSHCIVMETGGMKGRRKELIRSELHAQLTSSFGLETIHSEYGMTELLSQAYSMGNGRFHTPPWMKIQIRDPNDPLSLLPAGESGGINIIDLANLYTCSFIATGDLGKVYRDGSFEVMGRFDHSDIRGCNLMVL